MFDSFWQKKTLVPQREIINAVKNNKNSVPNDPRSPFVTSGLRIGTPAITTRGFKEAECEQVAHWMADIIDNLGDEATEKRVKKEALALCDKFPVYS